MRIPLIFFVWSLASVSEAATFYVATSGSDGNPGSAGAPFLTLNAGLSAASAGDVVNIAAGTYATESTTVRSGTFASPIRIVGPAGTNAVITGRLNTTHANYEVTLLTFDGQRIQSDSPAMTNWWIHHNFVTNSVAQWLYLGRSGSDPTTNAPSHLLIENNTMHGWDSDGVVTLMGVGHIVRSNRFEHAQTYDCLRVWGENHTISDNYFANLPAGDLASPANSRHGDILQTFDGATVPSAYISRNIVFERNYLTNCTMQFGNIEEDYGSLEIRDWVIRNNVWVNSRIQMNIYGQGFSFYNNSVYNARYSVGFRFASGAHGGRVFNNIFCRVGSGVDGTGFYSNTAGNTNFLANYNFISDIDDTSHTAPDEGANGINGGFVPGQVFTSSSLGGMNLATGSPAIGAGTNLSSVFTTDFIQGVREFPWDIGAYRYVPSSAVGVVGTASVGVFNGR